MLSVNEGELQGLFDESTFRRGRSYSRTGAVGDLRDEGERVRARVQGSRPRPYEVWVRRENGRIVSQCSCPGWAGARRHCKHVAALLYTLRQEGPPGAEGQPVPARLAPLTAWLPAEPSGRLAVAIFYAFTIEPAEGGERILVRQLRADRCVPPDAAAIEALAPEDRRLAELLARLEQAPGGGALIEISRAGDLLAALQDKPVFADDRQEIPLAFADEPLGLRIACTPASSAGEPFRFRAILSPRGSAKAFSPASVRVLGGIDRFALAEDRAYPLDPRLTEAALARLRAQPEVECRPQDLPRAFGEWLPRLAEATGAAIPLATDLLPRLPGPPAISLVCAGDLGAVEVKPLATYGTGPSAVVDLASAPLAQGSEVRLGEDGQPYLLERDLAVETAVREALLALGLELQDGAYRAGGPLALGFWSEGIATLPSAWSRNLPPALVGLRVRSELIRPSLELGFGARGWFEIDLRLGVPGTEIDIDELRSCLASGAGYATLRDGSVAPLDLPLCRAVLEALADSDGQLSPGKHEIPPWLAGPLYELLRAVGEGAKVTEQAAALLRGLNGEALARAQPPDGLIGTLRPYQAAGYAWLCFLEGLGLDALLADEMGLGKTIQALAFLLHGRERGVKRPALVVAPTSVLPNWIREAGRFAPSLRAVAFTGGKRKLPGPESADLVVTSYALLRRDAELLASVDWSTVILDEAQHIKNPAAATAQAARALRGQFRMILTGTPVENRPLDLWSLFEFLLPGLLGPQEEFRRRYEAPVGPVAAAAQKRLAIRIRPFLKRRLKRDVLTELPEKQESEVVCDLSEPQRKLYRQLLEEVRREVFGAIEKNGVGRSQVNILAGLLRLRQAACDPRLLKLDTPFAEEDSAKLMLWRELLDEALDGGHRIICFSQFVEMLTLMRKQLDDAKIPYEYLDGRTRDRQGAIDRFNGVDGPPKSQVFLISLRAGGTGVNLATADTVFLYDPWWNPAVEDQAVDRVHRIGQSREVSVYRLVARGTVEEKILELKQKKRDISGRLLGGAEGGGGSGAFTAAEVEELLRAG